MSDGNDESVVESYVLRLLDECREEIRMCDSKASILFAGVAFAAALLAGPLIDDSSSLRQNGTAVAILSVVALVALGCSMWLLGLAVVPRIAHPLAGEARYFEEQAQFEDPESLLLAVRKDSSSAVQRHSQQLLVLSHIAHRKYGHLRMAMYAVCLSVVVMAVVALIAAAQSDW